MADELGEDQATGEIAEIYNEVKQLWAVPYVSSIHRFLATQPGLLEWAWEAVAPVFRNGVAQEAGWRAADGLDLPSLSQISPEALAAWQIDDGSLAAIRDLSAGFVRVAPVNMVFAGLTRRLLDGDTPTAGANVQIDWQPPRSLQQPPDMVAMPNSDAVLQRLLEQFGTDMDGETFVPGLYRMLANWPGFLAHLTITLRPHFDERRVQDAYDALRSRIDVAVDEVFAQLPAVDARHARPSDEG
ncbi:MAG: hypothetical protein ACR2PA_06085, partial [Hyphomicrobiaceae bacterium]